MIAQCAMHIRLHFDFFFLFTFLSFSLSLFVLFFTCLTVYTDFFISHNDLHFSSLVDYVCLPENIESMHSFCTILNKPQLPNCFLALSIFLSFIFFFFTFSHSIVSISFIFTNLIFKSNLWLSYCVTLNVLPCVWKKMSTLYSPVRFPTFNGFRFKNNLILALDLISFCLFKTCEWI